jgi:pseudouridine kinase
LRLTIREKELLDALKNEPLISQDELANRFDISRSSIAVHISNLMKKGYVLGKGYVINEQASIVVFGETGLVINIRNEGINSQIDLQYGGISQQISHILSRFGAKVKLVTLLGNDDVGNLIADKLRENQVDTSNIYRNTEKRTSRKIIINGQGSFTEGPGREEYQKIFELKSWLVTNCEWLIVEEQFQDMINLLPRETAQMPLTCTYRFLEYPEEIPSCLADYSVLVIGLENSQYLDYYSRRLVDIGQAGSIINGIITDGASRVICIDKSGVNDLPLPPNQNFNTRGQLPLFMAGLIYGLSMGQPLRQAVRIGTGTAT